MLHTEWSPRYKLYVDCFARPISSAPDATVEVVVRVSRPLNERLVKVRSQFVTTEGFDM